MSDDPSFEEALARLEEILRRLEQGDVSLDEALGLWQRGGRAAPSLPGAPRPPPRAGSSSCRLRMTTAAGSG